MGYETGLYIDLLHADELTNTGFFAFGCAAMFAVFWELAFVARVRAKRLGDDVHRTFVTCGVLTLVIWMLYPIAWGVCEGGNVSHTHSGHLTNR